jgi:hypothetical protein
MKKQLIEKNILSPYFWIKWDTGNTGNDLSQFGSLKLNKYLNCFPVIKCKVPRELIIIFKWRSWTSE